MGAEEALGESVGSWRAWKRAASQAARRIPAASPVRHGAGDKVGFRERS